MRIPVALATCLALAACTTPTPVPSASATNSSAPKQTVAVYYTLAHEPRGPRLVREFHQVPVPGGSVVGQIKAAATEMLTHNALDPDYANLWPGTARVANVTLAGNTATVDLTGAATANLGAEASQIAVQQLVWTVTAIPNVTEVTITLDGKAVPELWGHVDISKPLKRAPAVDTLAPVWVISPQQGETTGREVTLHIAGIAFEATVNYEIRVGTEVVKKGFVTLSAGAPQQGEAKQTVTLEPGDYVIAAFVISQADSSKQFPDDHAIKVS